MDEELQKLYEKRAKLAEMESDFASARQFFREGGALWRMAGWFEKQTKRRQSRVQAQIDLKLLQINERNNRP